MIFAGIDLGGTTIKGALVTEEGTILAKKIIPTGAERDYHEIVRDMAVLVRDLAAENGYRLDDIAAVGIGSPGAIDPDAGKIVYAGNFANFSDVPCVELMHEVLPGMPIFLNNDANVAALGEAMFGAGQGSKSVVMVTLGTGVGGGIILDGKILSGRWYGGAELGHIVLKADGEHCTCGHNGCWEAYSSMTALIRMAREHLASMGLPSVLDSKKDTLNGRDVFEAGEAGDQVAVATLKEYYHYLSLGLASVINIFQPEYLIIGGGPSGQGHKLIDILEPMVEKDIFGGTLKTHLVIASLGNDAGMVGASMLAKAALRS